MTHSPSPRRWLLLAVLLILHASVAWPEEKARAVKGIRSMDDNKFARRKYSSALAYLA